MVPLTSSLLNTFRNCSCIYVLQCMSDNYFENISFRQILGAWRFQKNWVKGRCTLNLGVDVVRFWLSASEGGAGVHLPICIQYGTIQYQYHPKWQYNADFVHCLMLWNVGNVRCFQICLYVCVQRWIFQCIYWCNFSRAHGSCMHISIFNFGVLCSDNKICVINLP